MACARTANPDCSTRFTSLKSREKSPMLWPIRRATAAAPSPSSSPPRRRTTRPSSIEETICSMRSPLCGVGNSPNTEPSQLFEWRCRSCCVSPRARLAALSVEDRTHRERTHVEAGQGNLDAIAVVRRACRIEQRVVMVRRRMRNAAGIRFCQPRQRSAVVSARCLGYVSVERLRPRRSCGLSTLPAGERVAQIVSHVAAAQDEHTLLAQRRKGLSDGEMPRRRKAAIDAELDYRHVRVRAHVLEDGPGTMVEPPVRPQRSAPADQLRDLPREIHAAGCWIALLIELGWEPAEVVDGARVLVAGHERPWDVPVRGDAQDGLRLREHPAELLEAAAPLVVVDGIHRRSMADEQDRHSLHDLESDAAGAGALPEARVARASGGVYR